MSTAEPVEIAGTTIRAGQPVVISLLATNRDSSRFPLLELAKPPNHLEREPSLLFNKLTSLTVRITQPADTHLS
jgi:hypothetical protein